MSDKNAVATRISPRDRNAQMETNIRVKSEPAQIQVFPEFAQFVEDPIAQSL